MIMMKQIHRVENKTLPYESPDVTFVEVKSEGLLCLSGDNDEYDEKEFPW